MGAAMMTVTMLTLVSMVIMLSKTMTMILVARSIWTLIWLIGHRLVAALILVTVVTQNLSMSSWLRSTCGTLSVRTFLLPSLLTRVCAAVSRISHSELPIACQ